MEAGLEVTVSVEAMSKSAAKAVSAKVGYYVGPVEIAWVNLPGSCQGKYSSELDVIALAPRYFTLDRKMQASFEEYGESLAVVLIDYVRSHANIEDKRYHLPSLLKTPSQNQRKLFVHVLNEVLVHEYSHKVYTERYMGAIIDAVRARKKRIDYAFIDHTFDEAFALWLESIIVGHEHKPIIESFSKCSTGYLRRNGIKRGHTDMKQIARSYMFLRSLSDEKGDAYVLRNLPEIAAKHYNALLRKKEARRRKLSGK